MRAAKAVDTRRNYVVSTGTVRRLVKADTELEARRLARADIGIGTLDQFAARVATDNDLADFRARRGRPAPTMPLPIDLPERTTRRANRGDHA